MESLKELLLSAQFEEVDLHLGPRYQQLKQYLSDPMSVPPDVRQSFEALDRSVSLCSSLKPKDDEAFRFFLDESEDPNLTNGVPPL